LTWPRATVSSSGSCARVSKNHAEIIGIDLEPTEQVLFDERFRDHPGITFELGDVLDHGWPDASFDTVSIAHALCRFHDRGLVLARLVKLLRPGGTLVVADEYTDQDTDAAAMFVELHAWWAAVDRASGQTHVPSLRRHQLVALVTGLGLTDLRLFDVDDPDADPMDPAMMESIDGVIDRTIERATGRPSTGGPDPARADASGRGADAGLAGGRRADMTRSPMSTVQWRR